MKAAFYFGGNIVAYLKAVIFASLSRHLGSSRKFWESDFFALSPYSLRMSAGVGSGGRRRRVTDEDAAARRRALARIVLGPLST